MQRKLWTKSFFIIGICALAFYYLGPKGENLKGGIDLAGGTSLLYEIDTSELRDTHGAAEEVVKVLRKRVDPDNVRNLIWRVVGNTRIEILMPQPTERNRKISADYIRAIEQLEAGNISLLAVHEALRMDSGPDRQQAWQELLERYPDYQVRLELYKTQYEVTTKALKEYLANPESTEAKADWGTAQLIMARTREHLLEADITRQNLEAVLGLKGVFSTPAFVGKSADFPQAYDDQIARLQQSGPQSEQRKTNNETYLWLGEKELKRYLTEQRTHFASIEKLQAELKRTGFDPVLAQNPQDGKTYILSYASSNRRKVGLWRMTTGHPSRKVQILQVADLFDAWSKIGGQIDDPDTLKRLLRGQGVLEFSILPEGDPKDEQFAYEIRRLNNKGPELSQRKARAGAGEDYAWFEVYNPEAFRENMRGRKVIIQKSRQDGKTYVLAYLRPDKTMLMTRDAQGNRTWQLTKARTGRDRTGGPAVDFTFNPAGARLFEKLTRAHAAKKGQPRSGKLLAIVLDDMVYSAPHIRTAISRSGQITGGYTLDEARQLTNTLNAGSLLTKLQPEPIREYSVGPSMGKENRDRGAQAAFYALIAVAAFMVIYYLFAGVVANVALFMNLLLVLGIMSGISATFTLPGIAGLILTVGMSVDANVLIFERIREEFSQGSSLRMSIQNGYRKVFWTIFDANLTTLITALILYWVGSEQVKGFAITLGYGICMSMFTALFVTRTVFDILTERGWLKKLPMLRLIKRPNINWMAKRKTFYIVSASLVIGGLALFIGRSTGLLAPQRSLYDIEFSGGTSVWFRLTAPAGDGQVRQAVVQAGKELDDEKMASASVYAINPVGKERKSRDFKLDTAQIERAKVKDAIERAFADPDGPQLEEQKPVTFKPVTSGEYPEGLVPILEQDVLVGSSAVDVKLVDFIGGLKLTLENLDRPQRLADLRQRIRATRLGPQFSGGQYRKFEVFGLQKASDSGTDTAQDRYSSVVVAVVDPAYSYSQAKAENWKNDFARLELDLIRTALQRESKFQGVTQFSPEVASEAKVKASFAIILALLAIVGYVWVRFGKGRYGLAAIIALAHDVFAVLGLVALATFIYYTPLGRILGITDLKIDMTMVAAILTIIGYSLNDTIVVFDRIRENRGRLADISPTIVNASINQTMSRTLLTSATTLLAVLIMYIWGGPGIHGFTSAMILGVLVGTYSSIAIASPTVLLIGRLWQKRAARSQAKDPKKQ